MLLLALLTALVVYVLATRSGALGSSAASAGAGGAGTAADCPAQAAPSVENVSRSTLLRLREDLRGVMFGMGRRLYEQGLAPSSYAWSDDEPGKHASLPPRTRDPAGYELRWWAADRDDVVADVWMFGAADTARYFFEQAASVRCRPSSTALAASSPPGGRDLEWRNPDDFAQEDVYLLRGERVYRVGVVRAGAGSSATPSGRSAAYSLVNGLACALPGSACHPQDDQALAQETLAEQLVLLRRQLPDGEPLYDGAVGKLSGPCASGSGARAGLTGSAISEPLYYTNDLELRIGVDVYTSNAAARHVLARYPTRASLGCLARSLASALRDRRSHTGTPRVAFASAPIGQGALVGEVEVPFSYDGRAYTWSLHGVVVRQGRIIDQLTTITPTTNVGVDERLSAQLAQITAHEQR